MPPPSGGQTTTPPWHMQMPSGGGVHSINFGRRLPHQGGQYSTPINTKGLLDEKPTARKAGAWRESKDGQRMMLVITGFRAEGDRRRVCSTAAEAVRPGQIAAEAVSPGAENGRLQAKGSSGGAGRPAGHKAGPAGRSPEEQERRHHRRGRRGDRLAGALGARRDQRHAEEETRPRGDLRANREARACLSYRRARLIQRVERKEEAMCTYDGYVSPYLLRPPRSCLAGGVRRSTALSRSVCSNRRNGFRSSARRRAARPRRAGRCRGTAARAGDRRVGRVEVDPRPSGEVAGCGSALQQRMALGAAVVQVAVPGGASVGPRRRERRAGSARCRARARGTRRWPGAEHGFHPHRGCGEGREPGGPVSADF